MTRDALHLRLWPDGDGPEDQQLDAHRRRLVTRLRPALNERAAGLIQVIRGIGFRLDLRPKRWPCAGMKFLATNKPF